MTKRPDEILIGDRITYLANTVLASKALCQYGRVVAYPIADPNTSILWFPTRPDGAALDAEPTWIRHDRVVDAVSVE